jgi:plastocyanin
MFTSPVKITIALCIIAATAVLVVLMAPDSEQQSIEEAPRELPSQEVLQQQTPPPLKPVARNVTVVMNDRGYEPSSTKITQSETVTFVNESSSDKWPASNIHPTHEIYSAFDPRKPIPQGASWSFAFDRVGVWYCHDHLYPRMTCTVTVTPAAQ